MITPDVCQQVLDKQVVQKSQYDQHLQVRIIDVSDLVMVKNYKQDHVSWTPGTMLEKYGIISFLITLSDGTICRCHIDQIRKRESMQELESQISHRKKWKLVIVTQLFKKSWNRWALLLNQTL